LSTKVDALSPPTTLADVLDRLAERKTLARQRQLDLMSGVRQIARLLGAVPADLPADPQALRQRTGLLTPAGAGMKPSRLRNVRALLAAALDLTGAKMVRGRRRAPLTPAWIDLLQNVRNRFDRYQLSRFVSFASANDVDPHKVDDQIVSRFSETLERSSLLQRRRHIVYYACRSWNNCAQDVEGWPSTKLTVPDHRRTFALPPTAYPPSFAIEVAAYLDHLACGDLFGGTGRGAASPATVQDVRFRVFQMAAALVHSGRRPDTIQSLADLVTPEALKTILIFFWSRNGNRKTGHIHNVALAAIKIAKWWVKASPEQIEALRNIRRQVDPQSSGMTERNRARLRQFDDPENLRRLLSLPEQILRSLPRSVPLSFTEARRVQSALAIGILLVAPMRMKISQPSTRGISCRHARAACATS
jgi:hypothetical protein